MPAPPHDSPGVPSPDRRGGRVLYLPLRAQLVVAVEHDTRTHTWRCVRVTHDPGQPGAEQLTVPDAEIEGAITVPLGYPVGDDAYAAVWQGCVHARWPTGHRHVFADHLITAARRPGTVIVELDRHAIYRLTLTIGTTGAALRRLLEGFVAGGLLAPLDADHVDNDGWGIYVLTMPPHPVVTIPGTEPGA